MYTGIQIYYGQIWSHNLFPCFFLLYSPIWGMVQLFIHTESQVRSYPRILPHPWCHIQSATKSHQFCLSKYVLSKTSQSIHPCCHYLNLDLCCFTMIKQWPAICNPLVFQSSQPTAQLIPWTATRVQIWSWILQPEILQWLISLSASLASPPQLCFPSSSPITACALTLLLSIVVLSIPPT